MRIERRFIKKPIPQPQIDTSFCSGGLLYFLPPLIEGFFVFFSGKIWKINFISPLRNAVSGTIAANMLTDATGRSFSTGTKMSVAALYDETGTPINDKYLTWNNIVISLDAYGGLYICLSWGMKRSIASRT